jgi:hypothetical protein
MTVMYVLNQLTSKGVGGRTPYELLTSCTSSVQHLRTFEWVAYIKDTQPQLQKLEDKSKPMIFVGCKTCSMAYRAYDPMTKCIHISQGVVFNKEATWS